MTPVDLLASVLGKTGDLISAVGDDQWDLPTPCPDYDVRALVNHIVGWSQVFEAGARGQQFDGDPTSYRAGDDPATEFRARAQGMIDGWRTHGLDRPVRLTGPEEQPGEIVFNMTLLEYATHGWDLAVGTGQPVPFTEEEAAQVLARAEATLPAQYRGEGMHVGEIVPVDERAPAVDRLAGFMGRHPRPGTLRASE